MKTNRQLARRIYELELANEQLRTVNKYQADNIDFLLSNKPVWYKLFV